MKRGLLWRKSPEMALFGLADPSDERRLSGEKRK
jgi:hypothetical protein